jgi:hypothetical protein
MIPTRRERMTKEARMKNKKEVLASQHITLCGLRASDLVSE